MTALVLLSSTLVFKQGLQMKMSAQCSVTAKAAYTTLVISRKRSQNKTENIITTLRHLNLEWHSFHVSSLGPPPLYSVRISGYPVHPFWWFFIYARGSTFWPQKAVRHKYDHNINRFTLLFQALWSVARLSPRVDPEQPWSQYLLYFIFLYSFSSPFPLKSSFLIQFFLQFKIKHLTIIRH